MPRLILDDPDMLAVYHGEIYNGRHDGAQTVTLNLPLRSGRELEAIMTLEVAEEVMRRMKRTLRRARRESET